MALGSLFTVWHCLWTLLAALFGGFMAHTFSSAMASKTYDDPATSQQPAPRQVNRWLGQFFLYLTCVEIALVVFGARVLPLALWASLTYLFTWWLLGLIALRARHGPANQRGFWLGAAVLGTLFMIVAFSRFDDCSWPVIPTVDLLDNIRPSLPAATTGYAARWDNRSPENARVYQALDGKSKIQFIEETSLDEFAKYIQAHTVDPDGKGIAIHSAPDATSGPSTIRSLELDRVAVRTSLQLALARLDLTYRVQDGEIIIDANYSEEARAISAARDGFQVVGHCGLALVAAALAGAVSWLMRHTSRPIRPSRIAKAE
jgi:hypothetical protein